MLESDTNRHAFHRSAQYQLALRSKAGEERDGALIQLSVEPCSVTVRLAHVIHTHVGPRTNLFCFLCLRTVSGLTREHFKESFDAIFEHLANGGEGGKVSKYTIICLFVVKISKYTMICLFVVKISKYTMICLFVVKISKYTMICLFVVKISKYTIICLFVVKISKYTLSGVKVSKYTFGCLFGPKVSKYTFGCLFGPKVSRYTLVCL